MSRDPLGPGSSQQGMTQGKTRPGNVWTEWSWKFQRVLHTLSATQEVPRHTRFHSRGSTSVPPTSREPLFILIARQEGSFPCVVGKEFPTFPSHLKRGHSPQERREELQGRATIPRSRRCLSPFHGSLFSRHCLNFQDEDRLTPRWHVGHHCGKASWESLVGKRRGKASWKASRESH